MEEINIPKDYKIDKEDISRVSIPISDYMTLVFKSMMYDKLHENNLEYAIHK